MVQKRRSFLANVNPNSIIFDEVENRLNKKIALITAYTPSYVNGNPIEGSEGYKGKEGSKGEESKDQSHFNQDFDRSISSKVIYPKDRNNYNKGGLFSDHNSSEDTPKNNPNNGSHVTKGEWSETSKDPLFRQSGRPIEKIQEISSAQENQNPTKQFYTHKQLNIIPNIYFATRKGEEKGNNFAQLQPNYQSENHRPEKQQSTNDLTTFKIKGQKDKPEVIQRRFPNLITQPSTYNQSESQSFSEAGVNEPQLNNNLASKNQKVAFKENLPTADNDSAPFNHQTLFRTFPDFSFSDHTFKGGDKTVFSQVAGNEIDINLHIYSGGNEKIAEPINVKVNTQTDNISHLDNESESKNNNRSDLQPSKILENFKGETADLGQLKESFNKEKLNNAEPLAIDFSKDILLELTKKLNMKNTNEVPNFLLNQIMNKLDQFSQANNINRIQDYIFNLKNQNGGGSIPQGDDTFKNLLNYKLLNSITKEEKNDTPIVVSGSSSGKFSEQDNLLNGILDHLKAFTADLYANKPKDKIINKVKDTDIEEILLNNQKSLENAFKEGVQQIQVIVATLAESKKIDSQKNNEGRNNETDKVNKESNNIEKIHKEYLKELLELKDYIDQIYQAQQIDKDYSAVNIGLKTVLENLQQQKIDFKTYSAEINHSIELLAKQKTESLSALQSVGTQGNGVTIELINNINKVLGQIVKQYEIVNLLQLVDLGNKKEEQGKRFQDNTAYAIKATELPVGLDNLTGQQESLDAASKRVSTLPKLANSAINQASLQDTVKASEHDFKYKEVVAQKQDKPIKLDNANAESTVTYSKEPFYKKKVRNILDVADQSDSKITKSAEQKLNQPAARLGIIGSTYSKEHQIINEKNKNVQNAHMLLYKQALKAHESVDMDKTPASSALKSTVYLNQISTNIYQDHFNPNNLTSNSKVLEPFLGDHDLLKIRQSLKEVLKENAQEYNLQPEQINPQTAIDKQFNAQYLEGLEDIKVTILEGFKQENNKALHLIADIKVEIKSILNKTIIEGGNFQEFNHTLGTAKDSIENISNKLDNLDQDLRLKENNFFKVAPIITNIEFKSAQLLENLDKQIVISKAFMADFNKSATLIAEVKENQHFIINKLDHMGEDIKEESVKLISDIKYLLDDINHRNVLITAVLEKISQYDINKDLNLIKENIRILSNSDHYLSDAQQKIKEQIKNIENKIIYEVKKTEDHAQRAYRISSGAVIKELQVDLNSHISPFIRNHNFGEKNDDLKESLAESLAQQNAIEEAKKEDIKEQNKDASYSKLSTSLDPANKINETPNASSTISDKTNYNSKMETINTINNDIATTSKTKIANLNQSSQHKLLEKATQAFKNSKEDKAKKIDLLANMHYLNKQISKKVSNKGAMDNKNNKTSTKADTATTIVDTSFLFKK
ncbi:hypothetical protein ABSA28_00454 [Candidatus Hepatincolaceae symbiont of Richtersius coronifer]